MTAVAEQTRQEKNMSIISIREMLEAGSHFGHQTQRWNPKMKPYIFEARNGIHIINLKLTAQMFDDAYNAVRDIVADGGSVIFVGTKLQSQEVVKEEAERCGMFYVNSRWLGGTLTNFATIKKSIEKYNDLQRMSEEGSYQTTTKKEALLLEKKRIRMAKNFAGISKMSRIPGALFIVDPVRDMNAVDEAHRLGLPVIALADTNCDPNVVEFPIPANDDAMRSIKLFTQYIANAAIEGKGLYDASIKESAQQAAAPSGNRGPSGVKVQKARLGKRDERRQANEAYAEPEAQAAAEAKEEAAEAPKADKE